MENKLALGTAQFGLNYGINNKTGRVSETEVENILRLAAKENISLIDTARAYGNSEEILGKKIGTEGNEFKIVSKLPDCTGDKVRGYFNESLSRLKSGSIYGYLYHDFNTFLDDRTTLDELRKLKDSGKIRKIGFSLYYPAQLEILLTENISFDLLQMPYNLLDRRFEQYFGELKKGGIKIHTRSVFLQGLFFKGYSELSTRLYPFRNFLVKLNDFAESNGIKTDQVALGFALSNNFVDKVIVGIDNSVQLLRLINIEKMAPGSAILSGINELISAEKFL